MPSEIKLNPGSFRDPSGHVFEFDGRILRSISDKAVEDYTFVREAGFLTHWIAEGSFTDATEVLEPEISERLGCAKLVEHTPLPFISYPYEWSFGMLKAAALLHLDLQIDALEHDITFSDATAYNIQFRGTQPVFIDLLSLRRYREGEYWIGYGQFCEQFLNPLLLRARLGIPHNAWFRGASEGITSGELSRMLPTRSRLSWRILAHVIGPARMQAAALADRESVRKAEKRVASRGLSKLGYLGILHQLRNWITKLEPRDIGHSTWGDYEDTHTYDTEEMEAKRAFVAEFVNKTGARCVADSGCNTGAFSELVCESGSEFVIGFEYDRIALERAYQRAVAHNLNFTPLYLDAANPSPSQGWRQAERPGLAERAAFDAIIALAFEHHLAIGRNIPLPDVVEWLVGQAPRGIIEFVQKDDTTVKQMLALREDIFDTYSQDVFEQALANHARIEKAEKISREGRMLYWYERE